MPLMAEKFERAGNGWRLYVDDFDKIDGQFADAPEMPAFTAVRIHFDKAAPLYVERLNPGTEREFFTLGYGQVQIFFGGSQAHELWDQLNAVCSVGASVGVGHTASAAHASVSDGVQMSLTAPAEPTKEL